MPGLRKPYAFCAVSGGEVLPRKMCPLLVLVGTVVHVWFCARMAHVVLDCQWAQNRLREVVLSLRHGKGRDGRL